MRFGPIFVVVPHPPWDQVISARAHLTRSAHSFFSVPRLRAWQVVRVFPTRGRRPFPAVAVRPFDGGSRGLRGGPYLFTFCSPRQRRPASLARWHAPASKEFPVGLLATTARARQQRDVFEERAHRKSRRLCPCRGGESWRFSLCAALLLSSRSRAARLIRAACVRVSA